MVNASTSTNDHNSTNQSQKAQEHQITIQFIQNFNSTINTFIKQYNQIKLSSSSASCLSNSNEYGTSKIGETSGESTNVVAYEEDLELAWCVQSRLSVSFYSAMLLAQTLISCLLIS